MAGRALDPIEIPTTLWERPEVVEALGRRDMARVFQLVRQYAGASQTRIAIATGMSQGQVSEIMNGARRITAIDLLERIADGLDMPDEARMLLGLAPARRTSAGVISAPDTRAAFAPAAPPAPRTVESSKKLGTGQDLSRPGTPRLETPLLATEWTPEGIASLVETVTDADTAMTPLLATRLAHEWLVTEPPQLVEPRAGRQIGEHLVRTVERRVDQLRHMDDFIGGSDLHDLVEKELGATVQLLKSATYSEGLGRRLLIAVAELCQLTGWVAADAGQGQKAERYYTAGVHFAHAIDDAPLAANLISSLAYLYSNGDNRREAVLLARTACAGAARRATATTRALLQERVAWAHARVGDLSQAERALDAADRAFEDRDPADDPRWVYWLNREEIEVMAGRCYTELRRPARATPLLRAALGRYDEDHARETSLYSSWLAESLIQAGEVDEAAAHATRTLVLSARVGSVRNDERAALLRRLLRPYRAAKAVGEFEELYQELKER